MTTRIIKLTLITPSFQFSCTDWRGIERQSHCDSGRSTVINAYDVEEVMKLFAGLEEKHVFERKADVYTVFQKDNPVFFLS